MFRIGNALEQRADEELKVRAYTGYEGSFTGWLEPYVEPTWLAEIRDTEYEYKNGSYYVLGVETTFATKVRAGLSPSENA